MITNHFIHVHLPRTGGNTFRGVVRRLRDYDVVILDDAAHRPLPELQARCTEMGQAIPPAVTFVRDPWCWYPSQWRWLRYTKHADFTGDFAQYIAIVRARAFSDWNWFSLTGCYNLLGAGQADYTGTLCTFEQDVLAIFAQYAPDVPRAALVHAMADTGIANASPHDLACTWTRDNAEWVRQEDSGILEKFGYSEWPKFMED